MGGESYESKYVRRAIVELGQVDLEAHWALRRALSSKPWHRGVAQALLAAFQAMADVGQIWADMGDGDSFWWA